MDVLQTLNSFTPVGLAALLAYIIYLQILNGKEVDKVANNHLSDLPEMNADIKKLVTLMENQQPLLQAINDNLIYIKARVNGKS